MSKNKLSEAQRAAIKNLESAFKKCSRLGITFAGMDDSVIFATKQAQDATRALRVGKTDDYAGVAAAYNQFAGSGDHGVGGLQLGKAYQDSGGW